MEGDSTSRTGSGKLEGWQAIGHYLGVSARQAQTWRRELGLPIHGGRSLRVRVWALTHELDEWREGRRTASLVQPDPTVKTDVQEELPPEPTEAAKHLPAPLEPLASVTDRAVTNPTVRISPARLIALGTLLLVAGVFIGFVAHWRLVAGRQRAAPGIVGESSSPWEMEVIRGADEGTMTIWRSRWKDIAWLGDEGWLCGEISSGGPNGDVGSGILLHTADRGVSWTPVDQAKLPADHGTFRWGKNVDTWQTVGPIYALQVYRRNLGGGKWQIEPWFASTTGIYHSENDGQTWERSTPRPDDHRFRVPYADFGSLFRIVSSEEAYAVGWQGISHWTSTGRTWEVQLTTLSYAITAVYAYPADPYWDVWAVGASGEKSAPDRLIYHLKQRPRTWEKLAATGIDFETVNGGLVDIVIVNPTTGFAVGPDGVIVKGVKDKEGNWSWACVSPKPTHRYLSSVVFADGTLWIVGDKGTVLTSKDMGQTWRTSSLVDERGTPPKLSRVRSFQNGLWIVGEGVVYRYRPGISN